MKICNSIVNMNRINRFLVALLMLILWQSSLGANAALKDFSNVTTKSLSQNGYYKLPDGLILQWGYVTSTNGMGTIYFSPAFSVTPFAVSFTVQHNTNSGDYNPITVTWTSLTSSFFAYKKGFSSGDTGGSSHRPFYWFAVGRWK